MTYTDNKDSYYEETEDHKGSLNWVRIGDKPILKDVVKKGIHVLEFPLLESCDFITHAFSTRLGGVSEGIYSTMNFTFTTGDDVKHVMENYHRMADVLGVDYKRMVLSYQTHTTNVRVITEEDAGKGIIKERDYKDVDGFITDVPGITLVTFYADCVPLYFVDPVHHAVGLSHSGWRGTVHRMGQVTLDKMKETFATRPEDVLCCIGPSICKDHFEVGEEVIDEYDREFDEKWQGDLYYRKDNGRYQLDLWKANEIILKEAGVRDDHIQVTDICTYCNPDYLFSHRRTGRDRGSLAAFLCIKEC